MKQIIITLFIVALSIFKINLCIAQININDSLALVDLYNSTDGAHWTNNAGWLNGPVNSWEGISVRAQRVTLIYLSDNNLTGNLPASFGDMTELSFIALTNNNLSGPLPASFANLTKLTALYLFNNQLTGEITLLENCLHPGDFELSYNQFTGPLPNFQHIDSMTFINLDHNQLSGSIPESYGNFTGDQLTLDHNKLSGNIPVSLGNLSSTTLIFLSDNLLSGTVPISLINLPFYAYLSLENNHFNFDGLEEIVASDPTFIITYTPQQNIHITNSLQGAFGKLSVQAGGNVNTNSYQWYRNNSLYKTIIGDSVFLPDSSGVYFVKVKNAIVTDLQLTSDSIIVNELCAIAPTNTVTKKVTPSDALLTWDATPGAIKYQVKYSLANKLKFTTINTKKPFLQISGLLANTDYVWKVRAKCQVKYSPFSSLITFTTPPSFAINGASSYNIQEANGFSVYPNPAIDHIQVAFNSSKQSNYNISIYDIQGKILVSKTGIANAGINNFLIDIHSMHSGVYILKLQYDFGKEEIRKLVKSQ